ncbi:MAG: hypothetical protein WA690_06125 [Candidatus Acidiferrales bacterium]
MRSSDQLAVEIHYFPISADELAERSSTLRNLLLRGARRSIEQLGDRKLKVGKPEGTMVLPLDVVEK